MIPGYARVSTGALALEAPVEPVEAAGAERVTRGKVSGARRDWLELRALLDGLGHGDALLVTRLDRLAGSTRDLPEVLATAGERGTSFRSRSDAWADTTTPHGQLVLTVLGGLAEFERELIRARTARGRAKPRARGVRMGRRPKLTPHQRRGTLERLAVGEAVTEIARSCDVSHSTISRPSGT